MSKISTGLAYVIVFTLVVATAFVGYAIADDTNKCCKTFMYLARCSGCQGIDDDANGVLDEDFEYYVQIGDHPGSKCIYTADGTKSCSEELRECGTAGPVTTYEDNNPFTPRGCDRRVGIEINVTWYAMQCKSPNPDDPCDD